MAIKKEKVIKGGYTAEYWRIGIITFNRQDGLVFIKLDAYKDKDTRMENVFLTADSLVYNVTVNDLSDESSISDVYQYLKTLPEFDGATDI